MVCNRCIEAVEEELKKANISFNSIKLGEVVLSKEIEPESLKTLSEKLRERGFELLNNENSKIVDRIKTLIIDLIHIHKKQLQVNYSTYLEKELNKDYSYLSNLFSSTEGVTIEKYIIMQKVERIKELLIYGELNLSEIAHEMNYSSVQHLSNQFKKVTGMSPSDFKKLQSPLRKPLDSV